MDILYIECHRLHDFYRLHFFPGANSKNRFAGHGLDGENEGKCWIIPNKYGIN